MLKRRFRMGLLAIVFIVCLLPTQVFAYSYGDANTEEVAETFKLILTSLNGATPDWKAAEESHKTRRSEIQAHFGDQVALTLDKNIEAKDAKLVIANYKAVLAMNLDRRFSYALKDIKDYSGTKLLLAKAKATFDTMSPFITSGIEEINQAFDDALDALGNPGLFGVGKKEADPDVFKQKVNYIYDKVKPLFPYKAFVKTVETAPVKPVVKPSPSKEPVASNQPTPEAKPTVAPSIQPTASATPSPDPDAQPSVDAQSSVEPVATPVATISNEVKSIEATPIASLAPEPAPEATDQISQAVDDTKHAPMERTDKTNTPVTLFIIIGVILVGGGIIWFIRKKGLI